MAEVKSTPWLDGNYKLDTMSGQVFVVNGETVNMESLTGAQQDESLSKGTFKFGEFDEAHPEVSKHTGKKNNNVEISLWGGLWLTKGILSDDGKKITTWGATNELSSFVWLSEEDYAAMKDFAEPADAPSSCTF